MQFKSSFFGMQQIQNYRKLRFTAIIGSGLLATIIALTTSTAFAQQVTTSALTIQSTGTISGTLELPFFNPNYNKVLTIVDTDENGIYYRNVGKNNWVKVYQSDQVIQVRQDGSINPYVKFKGIPVVSFDAIIESPVLSDGEMTTFKYDGRDDMEGAVIKGVVQDEFGVKKAYYTGIVTDPVSGSQYKGTFELRGQGPRYSEPNGGDSPTVFDYKSDQPGPPRSEPYKIQDNSPLKILKIDVPVGTEILAPSTPPSTPPSTGSSTPTSTGGSAPTSTGGSTTLSTPPTTLTPPSLPITSTPSTSNSSTPSTSNSSTPSTSNSSTPSTSNSSTPSTSTPSTPSTSNSSTPSTSNSSTPSTSNSSTTSTSNSSTPSNSSNNSIPPNVTKIFTDSTRSISPSRISNVEFSGGSSFGGNSSAANSSSSGQNDSDDQISTSESKSKSKNQGPSSRVMIR